MNKNLDELMREIVNKLQDDNKQIIAKMEREAQQKEEYARLKEDRALQKEDQLRRENAQLSAALRKKELQLKRLSAKVTRDEQLAFYNAKHCYNREFGTRLSTPEAAALALNYFTHNWRKMNPKVNLVIVDENGRPIDEKKSND